MSPSKSFSGITPSVWECIKTSLKCSPSDGNHCTATISVAAKEIILKFDYDPSTETLVVTIVEKPFIVTDDEIWNGVQAVIDKCEG